MMFATNASYDALINDYNKQINRFQKSMKKLSTGERILLGDSPSDLGISERFRFQVKNGTEANKVIQNAVNLLESTDAWLQEVQNILGRMSELAISSSDGSKSEEDRTNLDLEFQQLKSEISRISESGKYNGLQINGKTAVAVWDSVNKRIVYSQPDGSDSRTVDLDLKDGSISNTGENIAFESSAAGFVGDFIFAENGKSIVYVAQSNDSAHGVIAQQTVMKLDIETKSIIKTDLNSTGGTTANTQVRIKRDEDGRVWVSNPASANGTFAVNLLNTKEMSLDTGGDAVNNAWAGGVTLASGFSEFTVHDDYCYFIETVGGQNRYVKQNIFDVNDKEVLISEIDTSIGLDKGETYTISPDGQYIAFKDVDDAASPTSVENLVIVNTKSGKSANLFVDTELTSIVGMGFDMNNKLYWTNTGDDTARNEIKRLSITMGDTPQVYDVETINTGVAGRFGTATKNIAETNGMGLSISDYSPASNYLFQVGAEAGMNLSVTSADVRLGFLGLSDSDVTNIKNSQNAIKKIDNAITLISNQRASLGSQVSRLNFTISANESFVSNLSSAENRIRDVDYAQESSNLTEAQIVAQASSAIIVQAKSIRSSILGFFQ